MPRVVALYRHPVKGFTPESCGALTVLAEGRIAGDRTLGFRFADSAARDDEWSRKSEFVALANTPALARLQLAYDHGSRRLRMTVDGAPLAEGGLDAPGREHLAGALARHVAGLAVNPLAGHPERLPLRLVGDGVAPRYQDSAAGQITLHSRESLAAVAQALTDPALDERRFRSNVAIEGVAPWEELAWLDARVRIGTVEFTVTRLKTRCLATHANPATGERDRAVMKTLVAAFGQHEPTFAIGLVTSGAGGEIRVGDEVRVLRGE